MHPIIYTLLRENIILCRLAPGAKLTEEQCANPYQSSRTTIRKVFDRLVEDGWLERSKGHRCKECFQEHYAIYKAIRADDESAAHKLTFQHIKMMLDVNMEE